MFYEYYEIDYPENSPTEYLFEAKSDEEALSFVQKDAKYCTDKEYVLNEITKPEIKKEGSIIFMSYETVRAISKRA